MAEHTISHADALFWGNAKKLGGDDKRGVPMTPIYQADLGAPLTLDANGLIAGATGTELPDTETVTYTFADDAGVSPLDGANQTGVLDVARNITCLTTHGSSIVAMTVTVTGTDVYGEAIQETITIAATGTSEADNGVKAFKTVTTIAITAAADAEANTLNVGWGDVLGLPYRLAGEYDVLAVYADSTEELASATVVAGVSATATATTGDVRGTVTPNTATDGSVNYRVWMKLNGVATDAEAYGVAQYGG